MAITVSGLYVQNIIDQFDATQLGLNVATASSWRISLHTAGLTPNYSTDIGYNTTGYQTNEAWGSGWTQGGVLLSAAANGSASTNPTLTDVGGTMVYNMSAVSVAGTSISSATGCLIYTTVGNKNGLVMVYFGAPAGYTTGGGTFQIAWSGSGVFSIDLTP